MIPFKVREQDNGFRYVTSHEQAIALGVTQDVSLPVKCSQVRDSRFIGNSICPAPAVGCDQELGSHEQRLRGPFRKI